ncbi:DsrE family protein [bacterium]|nr:DsrE family protein [bacterium]
MKILLILNRKPYDGTDVIWNALRLVASSLDMGISVNIFSMNESVDLVCSGLEKMESYDLQEMLMKSMEKEAIVKVCGTCLKRAGLKEEDVLKGIDIAVMTDLVNWIKESDKVLTF